MKSFNVRFLASLPLAVALAAQPAGAQQEQVDRALRDLSIMSNIFSASLEQGIEDGRHFPFGAGSEPEALYLAGQGMVFSFRTAASWYLPEQLGAFLGQEMQGFYREMQVFVDDITDAGGPDARRARSAREAARLSEQAVLEQQELRQLRQQTEQMGERVREQRQHVQELQRDLREMEREMRRQDGEEAEEGRLAQIEAGLEAALAQLEEARQSYEGYLEDYEEKRQVALTEYRDGLTLLLATTLCDYGPSLRSLQDEEHVTLVLKDFDNERDHVYVFSYADVTACESPENLLSQAVTYQL